MATKISIGSVSDLDEYGVIENYEMPGSRTPNNIVSIAIASSNDHVHCWLDDLDGKLKVCSGWSENLSSYAGPNDCDLPPGKKPNDIISMAIADNNHVYVWYKDGTVSSGTSQNLSYYQPPVPCNIPNGRSVRQLRAIAIRKSDDHVFYLFNNGTYCSGTSNNWDAYEVNKEYSLPKGKTPYDIIDADLTGSDNRLYVWYHRNGIGKGYPELEKKVDSLVKSWFHSNPKVPGITVAASKNGRLVLSKGYGYADYEEKILMKNFSRSKIGSVSKMITAFGVMKAIEDKKLELKSKIYFTSGILKSQDYKDAMEKGIEHFKKQNYPLKGLSINKSNKKVYAWYKNETVSIGRSEDLGRHSIAKKFSFEKYGPKDNDNDYLKFNNIISADFAGSSNKLYVWFKSGKVVSGKLSISGNTIKLKNITRPEDYKIPNNRGVNDIVGIGIANSNDHVYAWYKDGKVSEGFSNNLDFHTAAQKFKIPTGYKASDILDLAIAHSDHVYVWYKNKKVSSGWSRDLQKYITPVNYKLAANVPNPEKWMNWYKKMEVRHLLTHSSGIYRSGSIEPNDTSYKDIHLRVLSTKPLLFEPGDKEKYSNHGFGLSGFLLSHVTNKEYYDYISEKILRPMHMDDEVVPHNWFPSHMDCATHKYNEKEKRIEKFKNSNKSTFGMATGGWTAAATHLIRLMLATDQLPDKPDILKENTLQIMESRPVSGIQQAIGWDFSEKGSNPPKVKLSKNGSGKGGIAWISKYLQGYVQDGTNIAGVNVAVCTNIQADGVVDATNYLRAQITMETGKATIPSNFDLY